MAPLLKCSCRGRLATAKTLWLCLVQDCRGATVLRPGGLVGARCNRTLFTVGNHADACRVHTLSKQIVAGSSSTALAKGEVVLTGAALVTVTFDGYGQRRVAFQECSLTIERRLRIAVKHSAVIAEVYSVTNGSKLVLYAVNTPG